MSYMNLRPGSQIAVRIAAAALLTTLASSCASGQAPPASQRQINDIAATLERCRIALLETPRIRKARESLPDYINRFAAPQPQETGDQYRLRIGTCIKALEATAASLQSVKSVPPLAHNDASNRALWNRAVRDINWLPKRMTHVGVAWRTVCAPGVTSSAYQQLASEILQTLRLILDAASNLRDALP
jgi:hypothetical protein